MCLYTHFHVNEHSWYVPSEHLLLAHCLDIGILSHMLFNTEGITYGLILVVKSLFGIVDEYASPKI